MHRLRPTAALAAVPELALPHVGCVLMIGASNVLQLLSEEAVMMILLAFGAMVCPIQITAHM